MKRKPKPGTRVRLTSAFLRSTGQYGSAGHSRWTVQACNCGLCKNGNFVATDEPGFEGRPTHINIHNLEAA
jgi:hypothetical protein